jgi:predicted nucleotidyltransferase
VNVDVNQLAKHLDAACPEARFAFLFGSANDGVVRPGSDIDVGLYVDTPHDFDLYSRTMDAVTVAVPGAEPDISVVTMDSDVVLRFEMLKGRKLFVRDMDCYLDFFSLTCREYEDQMADYERQRRYRQEAAQMRQLPERE